jgi:hypothetical protein
MGGAMAVEGQLLGGLGESRGLGAQCEPGPRTRNHGRSDLAAALSAPPAPQVPENPLSVPRAREPSSEPRGPPWPPGLLNRQLPAPLVVAVHLALWGPLFKALFLRPWVASGMFGAVAQLYPQVGCVPV